MNLTPGLTTADLIELLQRCQLDILDGTRQPDPLMREIANRLDEWPADSPEGEKGHRAAKNFVAMFGGDSVAGMVDYWTCRDAVAEFQAAHNISGVQQTTKTIAGQQIEYFEHCDQLALIDGDADLTKQSVFPIVRFFCEQVALLGYELFFKPDDDTWERCPTERVWAIANDGWQVHVREESHSWCEPDEQGYRHGTSTERNPPDRITLGIATGSPDADHWEYFEAERPGLNDE